jgi:hypothetical protein
MSGFSNPSTDQGTAGVGSNLSALLNPVEAAMAVTEYAQMPTPGNSATILSLPAGTAGTVTKLKLILGASGNGVCNDTRLRISYDGGTTYPFDIDVGTLFLINGSQNGLYSPNFGACAHLVSQSNTNEMFGCITYPIPFTNGILIQVFGGTATDYSSTNYWSEATYTIGGSVSAFKLKTSGATFNTNTTSPGTNAVSGANGITLTNPNVGLQGGSLSLTGQAQIGQLANITGTGYAVGLSYVANCGNSLTVLERNLGWYLDGATPPTPSGSTTTPAHGQISGTQVGSPTFMTSGTEDAFDTAFYMFNNSLPVGNVGLPAFGGAIPATPISTTAYTNPGGAPATVVVSGVVTAVALDGVTTGGTTGSYTVRPGGTITLTGASPAWTWFYNSWPNNPIMSSPDAVIMSNGVDRSSFFVAHLDILSSAGGYKFNSSLQLWLLTEGRVTAGNALSWCLLYYQ